MKISFIRTPLYLGLSVMFLGTLFKIQHWPYGVILELAGIVITSMFCMLAEIEILSSKKAANNTKILWFAILLLTPLAALLTLAVYC